MIKKGTYLLLILVLVSCGGEGKKRIKKPDGLISKREMINIIYDMSLLSAAKGVNRKLLEQKGVHPEQYIYTKYSIDSVQFAQSNEYYAFDLDTYEEIYKGVKTKLEKDKRHFDGIVDIENKKKDSLNIERKNSRELRRENNNLESTKLEGEKILDLNEAKLKPTRPLKNVDSLKKLRNQ